MKKKRAESGSILIAVIWILAVLAFFSVAAAFAGSQELVFGNWMRERILGRALAKAGVDRAILEIENDKFMSFDAFTEPWASNEKALRDKPLGGGFFSVECPVEGGEGAVRYGACDESARLNLNTATEDQLKKLVKAVEPDFSETEAAGIADSILDWRDGDDAALSSGAETSYYRSLPLPYEPRNAPFESVEELLMVKGVSEKLFAELKPYLTVYTDGKVNFNTAPAPVLQAFGLSPKLALSLVEFRRGADGIEGTSDDEVFEDPGGIAGALTAGGSYSAEDLAQLAAATGQESADVHSNVFRIRSIGRLKKDDPTKEMRVTCVVKRGLQIVYWQEDE